MKRFLMLALLFQSCVLQANKDYCLSYVDPNTSSVLAKVKSAFKREKIRLGSPSEVFIWIEKNYFLRYSFREKDTRVHEVYVSLDCNENLISIEYSTPEDFGTYYLPHE